MQLLARAPVTVAFTGHRPDKLRRYREDAVRAALDDAVSRIVGRHPGALFLSGMALGVDQVAAELVIRARDGGLPCLLAAIVPFQGQDSRWPARDQERYRSLLARADQVVVLGQAPASWRQARDMLLARNRWMVRAADLLLAVWDGSPGGTAHTVREAVRAGVTVARFDPRRPELGWRRLHDADA